MNMEQHPHYWVLEPFFEQPSLVIKKMFGCVGCYLGGKLVLVLADDKEPWDGILIPTEKAYQEALISEFPNLKPHKVLGKWLYLSHEVEDFESDAGKIAEKILNRDPRFGVEPKPKTRRSNKKRKLE